MQISFDLCLYHFKIGCNKKIKTFKHVPDIEDFVSADGYLATSGLTADDDITDTVS
jgi:hypothetical protein